MGGWEGGWSGVGKEDGKGRNGRWNRVGRE